MFRKKISIDSDSVDSKEKDSTFSIRKKLQADNTKEALVEKKSQIIDKNISDEELIEFFATLLGDKVIKSIREKNYIALREANSYSSNREWIKSFIYDYFDISIQERVKKRVWSEHLKVLEESEVLNQKLADENEILKESLNRAKNENYKLKNRLNEVVEIKSLINQALEQEYDYENIAKLLKSSLKESIEEGAKFIIPFLFSIQKIIALKNFNFNSKEEKRDSYIKMTNLLLESISDCFISQRKDILKELALIISKEFEDINFVSPEDYRFVEPTIHNVPTNKGERVLEAKSFAVINKSTKSTLIYADIKAQ